MAEALLDSFLTCFLCMKTYTEPVSLDCDHSFCSRCLQQLWSQQPSRTCPVCSRSSEEEPRVNSALKKLSEQFRLRLSQAPPPPRSEEPVRASEEPELPQQAVESEEEAEERLKGLISSQLQALKEEKLQCKQLSQIYGKIQRHQEEQAAHCERCIRAVFSELHGFLQEEEQRSLSALREEQLRQKQSLGPELRKVKETLSSVSNSIKELEEHLQSRTYTQYQPLALPPRLQPKAGLLLDQAKVLGNLGFRVWRNMRSVVKHRAVVLDPNTAGRYLCLSDDLSTVRIEPEENEDLPLNPERFQNYASVLGHEGFSSGLHQWDVEVGGHQDWAVGVVKESFEKVEMDTLGPDHGHWCLGLYSGVYHDVSYKTFSPKRRPQTVRVTLDYDGGRLDFTDADHMTPICSYSGSFTEKLFPYLWVEPDFNGKPTELRVCEDLSS
uniref:Uncharacterized protein n=1 Tax=Neogobius melanostomus TaxID=47308 RepID=A0A8C6WVY4_9GOBI